MKKAIMMSSVEAFGAMGTFCDERLIGCHRAKFCYELDLKVRKALALELLAEAYDGCLRDVAFLVY